MTHEPGRPQPAGPPSAGYPYPTEGDPGDDRPTEAVYGGYRGEANHPGSSVPLDRDLETRWVPLVSSRLVGPLVIVGVVLGIAVPIVLWFTVKHGNPSFAARTGFLLLLLGIGTVIASLPLLLLEAGRLDRMPRRGGLPDGDGRGSTRGWTGTRMLALVGVLVIFAGAYLVKPAPAVAVERSTTVTNPSGGKDSGRQQPGGRGGGGGGGRVTPTPTPTTT